MYNKKVGHFSSVQKEYICLCLALDMEIPEIVENFQTLFPEVGFWLDPKTLKYKLARRISDIKRKNTDEIAVCRQKAKDSTQYALQANPMSHAAVRLRKLHEMYYKTPFKEIVGMGEDLEGNEFPVYKYNAMEIMKILKAILKEAEGAVLRYVSIDKNGKETEISAQEYSVKKQENDRRWDAMILHLIEGGTLEEFWSKEAQRGEAPPDGVKVTAVVTLIS